MNSSTSHNLPNRTWMNSNGNRARKRDLNMKKKLPCLSEVQARFGPSMSSIFFDFLPEEEKKDFGLIPKLQGPEYSSLWVEPNDGHVENIKLSSAKDTRYKKALLHHNILELGDTIEYNKILENEQNIEIARGNAIRETIRYLTKKQDLKKFAEQRDESFSHKTTSYDENDFRDSTNGESDESFTKEEGKVSLERPNGEDDVDAEQRTSVLDGSTSPTPIMDIDQLKAYESDLEHQLQQALIEREQYVMKKMNFRILWESEKHCEIYRSKILSAYKKWTCLYRKAKQLFQKELEKLRYELEAKHLADIQSIHRRKIMELKTLKEIMVKHFILISDACQVKTEKKEKMIDNLMEFIHDRENTMKSWEIKVNDIMKEFQKVLGFLLVETPDQSEFLLDFERVLEETLKVPQANALPEWSSSIEQQNISIELMLEEADQFLKDCNAPLNKIYSTSVEVMKQENEIKQEITNGLMLEAAYRLLKKSDVPLGQIYSTSLGDMTQWKTGMDPKELEIAYTGEKSDQEILNSRIADESNELMENNYAQIGEIQLTPEEVMGEENEMEQIALKISNLEESTENLEEYDSPMVTENLEEYDFPMVTENLSSGEVTEHQTSMDQGVSNNLMSGEIIDQDLRKSDDRIDSSDEEMRQGNEIESSKETDEILTESNVRLTIIDSILNKIEQRMSPGSGQDDDPLGKINSTSEKDHEVNQGITDVSTPEHGDEEQIASIEICSEAQTEKSIKSDDKNSITAKELLTIEPEIETPSIDPRLKNILAALKRHPSLQRIIITTNTPNK